MKEAPERLESPQLPGEVVWLLEEGFFGYLGTSDRDREPHVTPMVFVFDRPNIYISTSKVAKKLRNMRANPRVTFLVDVRDPSNLQNNRAVLVHGSVKIYSILDALLHFRQLLKIKRLFSKKYPKYMRVYKTERTRIPKPWRVSFFTRRVIKLNIEKFVYMRECRQACLEGGRR